MSRGFTPRHAQMVRGLGFAVHWHAETPPLSSSRPQCLNTDANAAFALLLRGGTRVHRWQSAGPTCGGCSFAWLAGLVDYVLQTTLQLATKIIILLSCQ